MKTRVLIVDDHPMVTEGIQAILESYDDIEVVGTLCNGQEAADRVNELAPDVILLDLNMPGLSGLSGLSATAPLAPSVDAPSVDAPSVDAPSVDAPMRNWCL